MPQSIPAGLTRDHILRAIADLDAGAAHPFGPPTKFELLYEGRRYAPKAVIGLACFYSIGRRLGPGDFSGGEARGRRTASCGSWASRWSSRERPGRTGP